eukprot:6561189-Pyramimonas_sp.AAC.1
MDTPCQDRVFYENLWTFRQDPRAQALRERKLTEPWGETQRAQPVKLRKNADEMNACYAELKDYSADDGIARIDAHEFACNFEVNKAVAHL